MHPIQPTVLKRAAIRGVLLAKSALGRQTSTVRLRTGELFRIRHRDPIGHAVLYGEVFEPEVRAAILDTVRPGMTVLDIGANIGYYSVLMASKVGREGRVVAFEPNPAVASELEENIRLNGFSNVTVQDVALSDHVGPAELLLPRVGLESHGSLRQNGSFVTTAKRQLELQTLDSTLQSLGIDGVDFVKMDIEGGELAALKGAERMLTASRRPTLVFECAEVACEAFGHSCFDVLRHVAERGYRLKNLNWGNWMAIPLPRTS